MWAEKNFPWGNKPKRRVKRPKREGYPTRDWPMKIEFSFLCTFGLVLANIIVFTVKSKKWMFPIDKTFSVVYTTNKNYVDHDF